MKLILYTGPNCCLCDEAMAIIDSLSFSPALVVEKVNIRDSAELYHLYALRIPVLKVDGRIDELGWPFTHEQLENFIAWT